VVSCQHRRNEQSDGGEEKQPGLQASGVAVVFLHMMLQSSSRSAMPSMNSVFVTIAPAMELSPEHTVRP
jgi:hypothetical protein